MRLGGAGQRFTCSVESGFIAAWGMCDSYGPTALDSRDCSPCHMTAGRVVHCRMTPPGVVRHHCRHDTSRCRVRHCRRTTPRVRRTTPPSYDTSPGVVRHCRRTTLRVRHTTLPSYDTSRCRTTPPSYDTSGPSSRCEISRSPSYRALPATSPVHARPVEPRTFQFDSLGCPIRRHLRPRAEKAGHISSNRLLQLAEVKRLPRAKNEIWYQRIPDPHQRPEGDQGS